MTDQHDSIRCQACRHFFITWDRNFPNGCRAMNFKSQNMPSVVTYQSSGMPCQRFAPKEQKPK